MLTGNAYYLLHARDMQGRRLVALALNSIQKVGTCYLGTTYYIRGGHAQKTLGSACAQCHSEGWQTLGPWSGKSAAQADAEDQDEQCAMKHSESLVAQREKSKDRCTARNRESHTVQDQSNKNQGSTVPFFYGTPKEGAMEGALVVVCGGGGGDLRGGTVNGGADGGGSGAEVGIEVGTEVGAEVGIEVGAQVGSEVGTEVGAEVGTEVASEEVQQTSSL